MDLDAAVAHVMFSSACQAESSGGKVNVNLELQLSELGWGRPGEGGRRGKNTD